MDARARLFSVKAIYDLPGTESLFLEAVRDNIRHHYDNCDFYSRLLDREGFSAAAIRTADDLACIPVIPAAFFKRHEVLSIPRQQVSVHATSSGTQGQKSQMFFDEDSIALGTKMVINCFRHHSLISPVPANYIMLGYEPADKNDMGAVKTAMGVTRFAPALSRTFVLRSTAGGYIPDWFGVLKALGRYERQRLPVRFVGFPGYLYRMLLLLKKEGLSFRLSRSSRVLLGGGWKQHTDSSIDKAELYEMTEEVLGVPAGRCRDFYSAVEHSVIYAECENRHFHVPVWSRVVIRDLKTLEPLGYGRPGFLSFVTPLVTSSPLVSVMMGDLAVLHEGAECGCGIISPYFEVLGRAGLSPMRNCAVSADELSGVIL